MYINGLYICMYIYTYHLLDNLSFNVMDDYKLIREVQKRPLLYSKGHPGYRNSKLRNKTWAEIGPFFKSSGEECCTRWRVIRDRYVKLIAKKAGDTPLNEFVCKWDLYKHLEFLQSHIQPRIQKRRIKDANSSDEADETVMSFPSIKHKRRYNGSELKDVADESIMSFPAMEFEDNFSDPSAPIKIDAVEYLPASSPTQQAKVPMQLSELDEKLSTFLKNMEKLLKAHHSNAPEHKKNEAFYRIIGAKLAELPEEEQEDTKLFLISHVFEKVKTYKHQIKLSQ